MFDHAVMMYFLPFSPKHVKLHVNIGSRNGSVPKSVKVRIIICHHTYITYCYMICNKSVTKRYFNYVYGHSSK